MRRSCVKRLQKLVELTEAQFGVLKDADAQWVKKCEGGVFEEGANGN